MRSLSRGLLFVFAFLLGGCAEMPMGQPQPTVENATRLRSGPAAAPVEVGSFTLDASKPASLDKGINLRSNSVRSPIDDSFAQYLRETLRVELQHEGLLDAQSDVVITGVLLESSADAPISGMGNAALVARFIVTRQGAKSYEKVLRAEAQWSSSFVGAVAIPVAAGNYEGLYRKLVGTLLEDHEFRAAIAKR